MNKDHDLYCQMRDIIINEILVPSLQRLYKVDYKNIYYGVSERNICARLAHHIEVKMCKYDKTNHSCLFSGYYADVEYDKMNDGDTKQFEDTMSQPRPMVSDLLIHSRGVPRNYLAVEMKRKKNYNKRREDRVRLRSMVSTKPMNSNLHCVYDTLVGAFIIFSADAVKIEIYENVDGKGMKTEEICLSYNEIDGLR